MDWPLRMPRVDASREPRLQQLPIAAQWLVFHDRRHLVEHRVECVHSAAVLALRILGSIGRRGRGQDDNRDAVGT